MRARGFTLVELLVATALLLGVSAAVAALAAPTRDAIDRSGANETMSTGARAAGEMLTARIREAGAPASVGTRVPLGQVTPVVMPLSDLDSTAVVGSGHAIRLLTSPLAAAQGVLRDPVSPGTAFLQLETTSVCPATAVVCGFQPGMTVAVHDDDEAAFITLQSVSPTGALTFIPGLPRGFAGGATVAAITTETYGIRSDGNGAFNLVRVSNGGAEQPILPHVVDFGVRLHDDLAIVQLRVQAASALLRGPAGLLFRNAGNARNARRLVPDVELQFGVALRNRAR